MDKICVAGAGTMGSGIAQVASQAGHPVILYDPFKPTLDKAYSSLKKGLDGLVAKEKITSDNAQHILSNISFTNSIQEFQGGDVLIEAIIEDLPAKKDLFAKAESLMNEGAILATNTSSLSIVSIAAGCKKKENIVGVHFFNPAQIMPLVEIIPAITTSPDTSTFVFDLIKSWRKLPVFAKDTPGFIVNRIARPYYGESIRILEEQIADVATIDAALKLKGGFKMGPFELMDMIGNDINYKVTETVWSQMFYDPRYKPSLTQKRLTEAGMFGRKSGKGYYDYSTDFRPSPLNDEKLYSSIFNRVIAMLINEAADALYLGIATKEDIDLAMVKGVNYPKGLLAWADELGVKNVLNTLDGLYNLYREERYRASVLLRQMDSANSKFY